MLTVVTLYKFVPLDDLPRLQQKIQAYCKGLTGTLLLAPEGINGTLSGPPALLEYAMKKILAIPQFDGLSHQYSTSEKRVFRKLKVRIKKEIVTMAAQEAKPLSRRGTYVNPIDWNDVLDQVALVIDVRNHYESRLGSFQGAVHPKSKYFNQFPDFVLNQLSSYKEAPIAMFCTGGIRCEKASSYMLSHGFKSIYQLQGGILQYLAHVPRSKTKWQGECFVFDERVALDHGLAQGKSRLCYGCRMPLSPQDIDQYGYTENACVYCLNR